MFVSARREGSVSGDVVSYSTFKFAPEVLDLFTTKHLQDRTPSHAGRFVALNIVYSKWCIMSGNTQTQHQTYEKDERWSAVDDYALQHLHTSSAPYYDALKHAAHLQSSRGLPDIAVSALQGRFLQMQCKLLGVKHALEVGTLGGYSTIWLAGANPDIKITTVEINEKHAAVAREAFEYARLSDRIEVIVGAGVDVLRRLKEEISLGKRPQFDFCFLDADKPNNLNYLNYSIPMSRKGACIIVDNVVRKGNLANAELAATDANVRGARAVVEAAGKDDRLNSTLLQIVGEKNYDGFLICAVE